MNAVLENRFNDPAYSVIPRIVPDQIESAIEIYDSYIDIC